jgi:hypothetical protein
MVLIYIYIDCGTVIEISLIFDDDYVQILDEPEVVVLITGRKPRPIDSDLSFQALCAQSVESAIEAGILLWAKFGNGDRPAQWAKGGCSFPSCPRTFGRAVVRAGFPSFAGHMALAAPD